MSLNKSNTRRLNLLAGSSFFAATLATAAFTGTSLAPSLAVAANECAPVGVDPSANGTTADVYACTGATTYQTTGVTYSAQGNLTVNTTGAMDVGIAGVNLTGANADSVTLASTGAITGSSGPVIEITTASGAINVTNVGVNATAPGATYGVRMESTGSGNITFTKTGTSAATAINNDVAGGQAAISAVSQGGAISLSATTGLAGSAIRGRLYGIVAETEGAGSVNINLTGNGGLRMNATDAVAGISATAGSGGVLMTLSTIDGGAGTAILANSPGNISITAGTVNGATGIVANGDGNINITANSQLNTTVDGIVANGAGNVSITANGSVQGGRNAVVADAGGGLTIAVMNGGAVIGGTGDAIHGSAGAGAVINNNGRIGRARTVISEAGGGAVDLSGVTGGGVTFNNTGSGVWNASGDSVFSAQNDLLVMAGAGHNQTANSATIDFGAGVDTFNMSASLGADHLVLSNLEAFNNSGTIRIGPAAGEDLTEALLSAPGATFTGTGASHIYVQAIMGGVSQVGCENFAGVAGCLDLRNGTTAGSTLVTVTDVTPAAMLSGYLPEGITIIDVSGSGTTSPDHFTFDLASTNGYIHPVYGPAFQRDGQAFVYMFRYDEENQRFMLISQPRDRNLFDYAILSSAAQSVWHMTAGTVTDRQTDLRGRSEATGLWLRTAGEVTRRDVATSFAGFDSSQSFDNSFNLYAGTITGGMDLLSGTSGDFDYVLGAQVGYVSSSLDMDESESSARLTGATGGLYGSLWNDWFFLDTALNLNGLALDFQHMALGSKTTTFINSVGASAEAGLRTPLTENTFAEPLAAVSWVRTTFEEISLREGEVQPADAESIRTGLGMRFGATLLGEGVSASYFVTGRGWYEFEGESAGVIHNPGADLPFADEFTGAFGEAELGINIFNAANTLSGFGTTGVKWKEGYSAVNLSLGVRMAW